MTITLDSVTIDTPASVTIGTPSSVPVTISSLVAPDVGGWHANPRELHLARYLHWRSANANASQPK